MFGVVGGIVAGSIVIELGVVPGVASSATALMIFYASAAATAKFAVFETITWDWALLLGARLNAEAMRDAGTQIEERCK